MPKVHVQAKIDREDIEWFNENYPGVSKQFFIRECFRHLRSLREEGALPEPNEFIARVVQEQREEM